MLTANISTTRSMRRTAQCTRTRLRARTRSEPRSHRARDGIRRAAIASSAPSSRASPFAAFGPARTVAAPLTVAELPPIHAVALSHDHYDHLDARTCAALIERFGAALSFFTPLGYRAWFGKLGTANGCTSRNTAKL
ncbi:MAG: MBL fold metallo-hydrolase [Gemmatimonadota bacterium]